MDSYKIAVSIVLANGVSSVLSAISKQMLGLNTTVGQVNKNFGKMAQVIGGVAAVMGGVKIAEGLIKLVEAGSKVNHELELMKNQSFEIAEIQSSMAKAIEVSGRVQQTTTAENLKHIRELRFAFGDADKASQYIEAVSKANVVMNAYDEKTGAGNKDQVFDLVKSEEMRGLTANPAAFMSEMNEIVKAVNASGGKVQASQFLSAIKYGRTAGLGWDDTFIGQYLPRSIQSMTAGASGSGGSGGPGNALMSAFAKVVQGQMPKKAAEEFEAMGLTNGPAKHIKGSSQSEIPGGIKGRDMFTANPYEWVQSVLMPALAAHGKTSQNDILQEVSQLFPVRTASQIISEMGLQGRFHEGENSPFEKDAALQRKAQGIDSSFDELSKGDWQTSMKAFHAQFSNLVELLGAPIVGQATSMLHGFNDALATMGQIAGTHPEGVKVALEVLAGLAGALIVSGIIALTAALAGLIGIGAGVAGVAVALAGLAAINIDKIANLPTAMATGLNSAIDAVETGVIKVFNGLSWAILSAIRTAVSDVIGALSGVFSGLGPAIISALKSAIGSIGGALGIGGGGGTPQKQNYNAAPPAGGGAGGDRHASVYMDGKKVGALITRQIAQRSSRPLEGSSYFDNTWHSPASDTALSMG